MKRCIFCGHPNSDDSQFCVKCGYKFECIDAIFEKTDDEKNKEPKYDISDQVIVKKEINSLAKVSLILSLISAACLTIPTGLPFAIVISLFGLGTGIVSIIRKPQIGRKKAIFGIVIGSIVFVLCIVMFIIAGPVIELLKEYLKQYCKTYSNSDECIMIEEMLPELLK